MEVSVCVDLERFKVLSSGEGAGVMSTAYSSPH